MEQLHKTKRKNNSRNLNFFPPLKFKKFRMKLDERGIHILISANFLKKGNYSITVNNGVLHLKIHQPDDIYGHYGKSMPTIGYNRDMDFHISLPDKLHQHLNSVHFHKGTLKIHLTDKARAEVNQSAFRFDQLAAS
tara:strand:- start:904 stop:1311 length:408 start_codon:yes stop_codon:yes gene_type:complete